MPARRSVAKLLADLARVLDAKKLRWYVFGAEAVIIHGVVRQSADVDVAVEVPARDVPRLIRQLARAKFVLNIEPNEQDAFIRDARVIPLVHEPTAIPLDLVLTGPGPEEAGLRLQGRVTACSGFARPRRFNPAASTLRRSPLRGPGRRVPGPGARGRRRAAGGPGRARPAPLDRRAFQ